MINIENGLHGGLYLLFHISHPEELSRMYVYS